MDGSPSPALGGLISNSMASLVQATASTPASKHSRQDKDVRFEKTPDKSARSSILIENSKKPKNEEG